MSDFISIEARVVPQDIDANSTTAQNTLGTVIRAVDSASTAYGEGEFIYLKGLDSTAVGECVMYSEDGYATKLAVANDAGSIAFAMSACVTGEYGWYQVKGKAVCLSAASNADNAAQYLTATPGTIDDAVVAGDRIHGCISASAIGTPDTGLSELEINYPRTDNIAD